MSTSCLKMGGVGTMKNLKARIGGLMKPVSHSVRRIYQTARSGGPPGFPYWHESEFLIETSRCILSRYWKPKWSSR